MILVFHLWLIVTILLTISTMFLIKYFSLRKENNRSCSSTYNNSFYEGVGFFSAMLNGFFVPVVIILIITCLINWPLFHSLILLTYICFGLIVASINRYNLIDIVDNSIPKNDKMYGWFYTLLIVVTILNPIFFIIDKIIKKTFSFLITNNVFYKTYKNKQKG